MNRILISILSIWFLHVHASAESSLNCSQYANDTEVIRALPFYVPINPDDRDYRTTYAVSDANQTIFVLSIANEKTSIPSTIFCLSSLKYLFIRNANFCPNQSSICQLPSEIERLSSSLQELDIFDTKVTHLPTSFGKLKQLIVFDLWNTGLMTLPNSFASLTSLSSLTITFSQLKSLPKPIGLLTSLGNIYLNNNYNLQSIDSLTGLPKLVYLSAVNCSITRIPIHLPNVSSIDMSNNKLTNLNGIETLGTKTDLIKIYEFGMNQIRSLPSQINAAYKLSTVKIAHNQLTNLPSTLFGYQPLRYFDIRNNLFSPTRLQSIVTKFNSTNPSMFLLY